jgi:hypothetical protein
MTKTTTTRARDATQASLRTPDVPARVPSDGTRREGVGRPRGARTILLIALVAILGALGVHATATADYTGWSDVSNGQSTATTPVGLSYLGQEWLFIRDPSGRILYNRLTSVDGPWTGWKEVPGNGRTTAAPTVTVRGNTLHVFVRGTDGYVWGTKYDGAQWGDYWGRVPDSVTPSAPAATAWKGQIYLFIRTASSNLIGVNIYGSQWGGWSMVDAGTTLSAPAVGVNNGGLFLFVRGTDDRVWGNAFNGFRWNGWAAVPGGMRTMTAPAVEQTSPDVAGYVGIAVRGNDGVVYTKDYDYLGWHSWTPVRGLTTPAGPAWTQSPFIASSLYARTSDGRIWRNFDSIVLN